MNHVRLGFEVGSGAPVEIPLKHLAVCGQTQDAGKTTTLEALIARSGLRAVTFITKRGEGSFAHARRAQPYFREQADWQYVAAILEASRGEKLKLERAFIIRASKGARTLADVQTNVRALLDNPKLRGMAADMYLCLDAYLEVVVPQIARVKWASTVELSPGVNVMDLGGLPLEMQHLVIRSTINWVLEHEQGTVVVVPEAWKFIPQGRGTPVKLAAEAFVRQGAALGNYLWLDSQDLGGIEKAILRSVAVWLLGVQREANEIKRTLDNIPAGTSKPRPADIAQLELGQFYACWGRHVVKTYVQPSWASDGEARGQARGEFVEVPGVGRVSRGMFVDPEPKREGPEMCELHKLYEGELVEVRKALSAKVTTLEVRAARSEERARVAEEKARKLETEAAAATRLRETLSGFMGVQVGVEVHGTPLQVDEIVARVLARIPTNGSGPITVTPPEKLRKDFQREESERILGAVRGLDPLGKRVVKLMEGLEGAYLPQKQIAERLGRATGGGSWVTLTTQVKHLAEAGLVEIDGKRGVHARVRSKIADDLATYQASDGDVEAVYQSVLYEVATEGV